MQKLFDGVFLLEGEVGGRPLQLIYLRGESASLLMDTGCAADPARFIVPQIKQAGGDPAQLTWILNTHPDLDHTGGNHAMKQFSPAAILACGDPDRHICQSFEALMQYRYDIYRADHQIFYEGTTLDWFQENAGPPQPIEATFRGGEHLHLGKDWDVELLAVPGHAKGHLAVYDPRHSALYGGDAIQGGVYLGLDGMPKLCPTYTDVDDYLSTIQLIEHLPIDTYVGCHWPVKHGAEVAEFCRESREFVDKAEILLRSFLATPHSLREMYEQLGLSLGDWPRDTDMELVYALNGHLERLAKRGEISGNRRSGRPGVMEYRLNESH